MNDFTKEELESIIQVGDTTYGINFVVTQYKAEPFADSVCLKHISDTPYRSSDVFKSKREAVDMAILRLKEVYNE